MSFSLEWGGGWTGALAALALAAAVFWHALLPSDYHPNLPNVPSMRALANAS